MTVSEIIEALTPYTGTFPKEAVTAAMAQKEEITPHLLQILDDVAVNPAHFAQNDLMPHLYAAYLLAYFREQRAYPLLTRLLNVGGDLPYQLFGETLADRLKNILASVYNGDPEPLKRLAENGELDEFLRGTAVNTFAVLAHTDQIPRATVMEYFRELYGGRLEREAGHVWDGLASAVADLPAPELLDAMRQTFEEHLADSTVAGFEELEREAKIPLAEREDSERAPSLFILDTVTEMEWWAAFQPEPPGEAVEDDEPVELSADRSALAPNLYEKPVTPVPVVRAGPKISRNDPCPCGSGKKYKKCCLDK